MGNNQISHPNINKTIYDYEGKLFSVGSCEMQGWRMNMEDSKLIFINDIEKSTDREEKLNHKNEEIKTIISKINVFGIFDGHGGDIISKYISENFMTVFEESLYDDYKSSEGKSLYENQINQINHGNSSTEDCSFIMNKETDFLEEESFESEVYIQSHIQQALIKTFLKLDEKLLYKSTQKMLFDYKNQYSSCLKLGENQNEHTNQTDQIDKSSDERIIPEFYSKLIGYSVGSTANIACIYKNHIHIANIGDSMSVLYKNNKAELLNIEHKPNVFTEKERILSAGLSIINERVEGKLNLTRAIGDLQFKDMNLKQHLQGVTSYPELNSYKLDASCEFLVIGCDGIWEGVYPQRLCEYISSQLCIEKSISTVISSIEDMILSKDMKSSIGTDNMSCIIVKFHNENEK